MNSSAKSSDEPNFLDFKDKNIFAESFSVMDAFRQQRKLCDVILKVADKTFYAHRLVLAASIPCFCAMFTETLTESQLKEITMKEIEPSALEKLINFAYRGEVRIDSQNVRSLMIAASHLQLSRVRDACAEFLVTQLDPADVLRTRSFAKSMNFSHLATAAEEYIRQHFGEVATSEEFVELNSEDLLETIEHDDLEVDSEETTYEASMRWVKANQEERAPLLPQILSKVRLNLLSPQFLVERVSREDLIRRSWSCRDLVDEAKDFHLLHQQTEHLGSSRGRHSNCGNNVGKIYVVGGYSSGCVRTVEIYDPVTNKWEMGEKMPTARYRSGAAVSLGKLYVFGGWYTVGESLSTVEVFDPKIKKWSQGQEMMTKRRDSGVAVVKNLIYVCGGFAGKSRANTVECYCSATDTWNTVAPMMECRNGGAATPLGGYVYVAGGNHKNSYLDSVEKYDPAKNSWIQVKPMIHKRSCFGLTALNGKLYACGGRNENGSLQSAEVYNPAENAWKLISPMNCKRNEPALVGNMGKLWAIGGYDGETRLSSVEMYDHVMDKWSYVASMSVAREGAAAAVIGELPFA